MFSKMRTHGNKAADKTTSRYNIMNAVGSAAGHICCTCLEEENKFHDVTTVGKIIAIDNYKHRSHVFCAYKVQRQRSYLECIIAFDELKTDYKNPIDQCNSLNPE
ncbi:CNI-like protein [Mya arenaria]|uniref:CNI-like protein n=1 Tax=Mya arenaria TaxID=6604 RepID=A0ABY7FB47_MYAAR|nr:CNI-like protein [Mya arenaria]